MPRGGLLGVKQLLRRLCSLMFLSQLACPLLAWISLAISTTLGNNDVPSSVPANNIDQVDKGFVNHNIDEVDKGFVNHNIVEDEFWRSCPVGSKDPKDKAGAKDIRRCPSGLKCSDLGLDCIHCTCDYNCTYGQPSMAKCVASEKVDCTGDKNFTREFRCSYCYLTDSSKHSCTSNKNINHPCSSAGSKLNNKHWYVASCNVSRDLICLGSPTFSKRRECNWTEGYSWKTALALSVTLGGFGADRFYLGHWQEGIGKLFSFGGLGVWTLVDVVLVAIRYIGPADGSLYI